MPTVPTDQATRPRRGGSRSWRLGTLVATLAGAALLATGCQHSATPQVADLAVSTPDASAPPAQGRSDGTGPLAFSACMRSNGVPSFPDPDASGRMMFGPDSGFDPQSPEFQSAQQACQSLIAGPPAGGPGGPADPDMAAAALKFSECIRSHGFPDFPDPDVSGNGVRMQLPDGIDPQSPQFQDAQNACQSMLPGGGPGGATKVEGGQTGGGLVTSGGNS